MENLREQLVEEIIKESGDELNRDDLIKMAKESLTQLVDRLVSIKDYYKSEGQF